MRAMVSVLMITSSFITNLNSKKWRLGLHMHVVKLDRVALGEADHGRLDHVHAR